MSKTIKTTSDLINEFINLAKSQIGTTEMPAFSNKTKYNRWYYGWMKPDPWCAIFVSWCLSKTLGFDIKENGCDRWMKWYKSQGLYISPVERPQPGDLCFMAFNSYRNRNGIAEHIGIVESVSEDGKYITTLEGNTSTQGSQDNGGAMLRKTRIPAYIVGYGRPPWEELLAQKLDPKQNYLKLLANRKK